MRDTFRCFLLLLLGIFSAIVFGVATASFAADGVVSINPTACGCSLVAVSDGIEEKILSADWRTPGLNVARFEPGFDLHFDLSWACVKRDPLNDVLVYDDPKSNIHGGCVVEATDL